MKWRFISFERYNPYFKTGLNQAALESVADGADPIIFLAGWSEECVNLGRSQNAEEQLNLEKVRDDNITVVRRQGGGGTTYLTPEGEITWGLVAPEDYFPDDVNRIYRSVCSTIANSLDKIGIDAQHEPINDVVTNGRKISGATMRRENGAVYVGGTSLYDVNPEKMFEYLTPGEDKLKDKQIEDFRDRVTSIKRESDASFDETRKIIRKAFLTGKDWKDSSWTEAELTQAQELANKYASNKWLYRNHESTKSR